MKVLTRVTAHKKPRFQFYQYGFNAANGCWLEGDWVTVSEADYLAQKSNHEALYQHVHQEMKSQHYRNPAVPPNSMTPAQRQAWDYFSGTVTVYCKSPNGDVGPFAIDMAGSKMSRDSIEWLRKIQVKVLLSVQLAGNTVNQQEKYGIPDDLVDFGSTVDPWVSIVQQNKQRMESAFEMFLHAPPDLDSVMSNLLSKMPFTLLVNQEEDIIRTAWKEQTGQPDPYSNMVEEQSRYAEMRQKLQAKAGANFEIHYESERQNHNEIARMNLDNSNGSLHCFVLPPFHANGTFEPWGPRDVPWG